MAESFSDMEKRLKAQAKLGEDLRKSTASMAGSMKDYLELQLRLTKSKKVQERLEEQLLEMQKKGSGYTKKEIKDHKILLNKLKEENVELAKGAKILKSQAFSVKNMSVAVGRDLFKGLKSVSKEVKKQSISYFEQEDSIRRMSVNVGIMGKQQIQLRKTLYQTSIATQRWGVDAKALGEMYGSYVDNVGRLIPLSNSAGKSLALISQGTSLGAEGAAEMASNMEIFGLSIKSTAKYVENVSNMSEAMGVSSGKVLKVLNTNMKQAQTIRFKDGIKGMAKMAALSVKMRTDMGTMLGFAQDLWEPEKAIETAATLQMMGGAFAKMADPLQLMFSARNDPAKLMTDLAEASASVVKNMGGGVYDIPTMELQKLKQVAEATGVPFEEMVTMGKTMAKQKDIGRMLTAGMKKEDKDFIKSIAEWDTDKGGFVVSTDGVTQTLVKDLSTSMAKSMRAESASLEKRAKESQGTMTLITNFISSLKPLFYNFMQGVDKAIRGPIEKLLDPGGLGLEDFGKKMTKWGEQMGAWISGSLIPFMTNSIPTFIKSVKDIGTSIAGFFKGDGFEDIKQVGASMVDGVTAIIGFGRMIYGKMEHLFGKKGMLMIGLALLFRKQIISIAASMTGSLIKAAGAQFLGRGSSPANPMWTAGGGGMGGGGGKGGIMGRMGGMGKNLSRGLKIGGGLALGGMIMDASRSMLSDPDSDLGQALGIGGSTFSTAGGGAMIGSLFGPVGTLIGGVIGGVVGLGKGMYDEFSRDWKGEYDIGAKMKDKGYGNIGMGGASTGRMLDGQVSPSGNAILTKKGEWFNTDKNDYITASTNQPGEGGGSSSSNVTLNGTIKLEGGGVTKDLMDDPIFIKEMTKKITNGMKTVNR